MTPEQEAEFKRLDNEVVKLRDQAQAIQKQIEKLKQERKALKVKIHGAPMPG